jgi:16S rRNA processing protein RimM
VQSLPDDVIIARILRTRGIRGEVVCTIETDFPERFETLSQIEVVKPDAERLTLTIEKHWFQKGRVVLKFHGYDSIESVENLIGGVLVVSQSARMALEEGEFYEYDVVGSRVVTTGGNEVGTVDGIMRTGGTDVLIVRTRDGQERLIPFADSICTDVDLVARIITVDPPEGLLEL